MKEIGTNMAGILREALASWLALLEQLPQHPPNKYTEKAVEAVQAAYQEGHVGMSGEAALAWLKKHARTVWMSVNAHYNQQMKLTSKRIEVVKRLSEQQQQQPPLGGDQAASSQLAAQMSEAEQACILLGCELQAYRSIGPAASISHALIDIEDIAAAEHQHKHLSRRDLLAGEVKLVNEVLGRMRMSMSIYPMLSQEYCDTFQHMAKNRYTNDIESSAVLRGQRVAAAAALRMWIPAALRFPAHTAHGASEAMLAMVDFSALLRQGGRIEKQLYKTAAPLLLSLLARQDLLAFLLRCFDTGLIQALMVMCRITTEQLKGLRVPKAAQQQLMGWWGNAQQTAAQFNLRRDEGHAGTNSGRQVQSSDCNDSISNGHVEVRMPDGKVGAALASGSSSGSSSSSKAGHTGTGAAADVGGEAGDMQELIQIMYGMASSGK